jgi:hypothetical protein
MKDITGKEFAVGDHVAYPQRMGSSMWMQQGRVTEVDIEQDCLWIERLESTNGRSYPVTRYDNVVIIARAE